MARSKRREPSLAPVNLAPLRSFGAEGYLRTVVTLPDPVTGAERIVVGHVKPGGVDEMHAKGRVTDLQKAAADRFLSIYETARSDGVAAIDYSKLRVDCAGHGDAFSGDYIVRAIKELARVESVLGSPAYGLLVSVIAEGRSLRAVAREIITKVGGNESAKVRSLSTRLSRALDGLDAFWNTAVGEGAGMVSDAGERTTVQVELKPVVFEAANDQSLAFVKGVARLREAAAKRKAGG